jgi:hypothetical protein
LSHQTDPWGVLAYVVRTEGDPKQYVALSGRAQQAGRTSPSHVSSMEAIRETTRRAKFNMF